MATETDTQENTLMVHDLDHFVTILTKWHSSKVRMLEYMMEVPSGTEVSINGKQDEKLEGDLLRGFSMGIYFSLMQLGKLPFAAEMENEQAASPTVH